MLLDRDMIDPLYRQADFLRQNGNLSLYIMLLLDKMRMTELRAMYGAKIIKNQTPLVRFARIDNVI